MKESNLDVLPSSLDRTPPDWLILVLIIAVILVLFLFKREIGELIKNITDIQYKDFKVSFSKNLQEARQQKNQHADLAGVNRKSAQFVIEHPGLLSREIVIEAWARLIQNIYDASVAQKNQSTVVIGPLQALGRLKSANAISEDQYDYIALLMVIGQQVADSTNSPSKNDAVIYRDLVYAVLDWMMSNAFSTIPTREKQVSIRKTVAVASSFSSPSPGKPSVKLIAISGPQMGSQFNMEKMVFTIGKNSSSDLQVVGDNFVSNVHAQLRFDKGNILLSDMGSTNGTYLNEIKLKDSPMHVNVGDKIKVGNSIFELK